MDAFGAAPGEPILDAFGAPPGEPILDAFGAAPGEPILDAFGAAPGQPILDAFGVAPGQPILDAAGVPRAFEPVLDAVPATALVAILWVLTSSARGVSIPRSCVFGATLESITTNFPGLFALRGGLSARCRVGALHEAHLVGTLGADDFSFFGHGKALQSLGQ